MSLRWVRTASPVVLFRPRRYFVDESKPETRPGRLPTLLISRRVGEDALACEDVTSFMSVVNILLRNGDAELNFQSLWHAGVRRDRCEEEGGLERTEREDERVGEGREISKTTRDC